MINIKELPVLVLKKTQKMYIDYFSLGYLNIKLKKINLIIYGKLLLKYKILLRNKVFMKKLNFFYYYTGIAHNGCKLKKKCRK